MKQLARQESSTENTTTQPYFICGFDDGARSTACTNPAPDDASYCSQHDPEVVTIERSYLVRVVQTYTGRLPKAGRNVLTMSTSSSATTFFWSATKSRPSTRTNFR